MTNKWIILRRPQCSNISTTSKMFLTITRLHNFCINEGENILDHKSIYGEDNDDLNEIELELGYLPSDLNIIDIPGNSTIRRIILEEIVKRRISRPEHNLVHNILINR